jgi:hypothetical protein
MKNYLMTAYYKLKENNPFSGCSLFFSSTLVWLLGGYITFYNANVMYIDSSVAFQAVDPQRIVMKCHCVR